MIYDLIKKHSYHIFTLIIQVREDKLYNNKVNVNEAKEREDSACYDK